MSNSFAATSLVWVNGQVTIPKYVLDVLGVHSGHHESVTFIIEGDTVRLVNSAVFSMQHLQNSLKAGDPDNGIAPGTKWEDLPEDFVCPICGIGKEGFSEE